VRRARSGLPGRPEVVERGRGQREHLHVEAGLVHERDSLIGEVEQAAFDRAGMRRGARVDRLAAGHDLGTRQEDRALVHADFGLHNIVVDPATGAVNGVFDYGSAAWADRHLDFRYLVFAAVPDALLDAATTAYCEVTGVVIDHHRVLVCNALAAIGHLADRVGHGEDEHIGGRTLAGDVRWTEWALKRAGFR